VRIATARAVTLVGWFALLALVLCWHAWWHPSRYFPTALVLVVTAFPMLLPLRGLLHGRPRAHLGASFLMLLYLMHGAAEAYANPPQRLPALLELALSLTVLVAAALYSRWTQGAVPAAP